MNKGSVCLRCFNKTAIMSQLCLYVVDYII